MKPSNLVEWRLIEGWLYYEEGDWLCEQVRSLPDEAVIVEVGAGKSTCAMALGCKGTARRVYSIDCQSQAKRRVLENNLRELGVAEYVIIIEGKSLDVAQRIDPCEIEGITFGIDFFFLDGDHEQAAEDIRAWRPYVDGIFAVHDAAGERAWPKVQQAVEEEFEGLEIGQCCSIAYVDLRREDEG